MEVLRRGGGKEGGEGTQSWNQNREKEIFSITSCVRTRSDFTTLCYVILFHFIWSFPICFCICLYIYFFHFALISLGDFARIHWKCRSCAVSLITTLEKASWRKWKNCLHLPLLWLNSNTSLNVMTSYFPSYIVVLDNKRILSVGYNNNWLYLSVT